MRDDGDFSAYAVARWPALVRTLVLLGSRPDVAPGQARAALARLRGQWARRDGLGDLDAHLYLTVLECRRDEPSAWWEGPALTDEGPTDPAWPDLERQLDRMSPTERSALALEAAADLAPSQVEQVLGGTPERPAGLVETVRRVAASTPVPPLELAEVADAQRRAARGRRRRALRTTAAALAVLAVVGGGWTWWATRPPPPAGLADAAVERADNPVSVGWYTDDTLHLDQVELSVEAVQKFADYRGGAVYADATGELVHVREDGRRELLGTQVRDGSFAVSEEEGLVAWVDVTGEPELRVHDLVADAELVRLEVAAAGAGVVAIDDGSVFYGNDTTFLEYDLVRDERAAADVPFLLDAASGVRVSQSDPESLLISRGPLAGGMYLLGSGARLSPGGGLVLTRTDDGGARLGRVRIYDTVSGEELATGLPPDAEVFSAALGDDVATYLVELAQDEPDDGPRLSNSGSLQLTTCPVPEPGDRTSCTVHLTFPRSTSWALAQ